MKYSDLETRSCHVNKTFNIYLSNLSFSPDFKWFVRQRDTQHNYIQHKCTKRKVLLC
jgi:hypothetical protein